MQGAAAKFHIIQHFRHIYLVFLKKHRTKFSTSRNVNFDDAGGNSEINPPPRPPKMRVSARLHLLFNNDD